MNHDQVQEALRSLGIEPLGFTGEWVQARCPFAAAKHPKGSDKSPSFGVKVGSRSYYNCFTCKSRGQFIDLPREMSGDGKRDYSKLAQDFLVAEATGLVIEAETYEALEDVKPLPEEVYGDMFEPVDGRALAYLESRGISMDTADRLGLGDFPEDSRVMFPIRGFDRKLYSWTGRSYDPSVRAKVWNMKGFDKSAHLLGADLATCDRPTVLVEGLMFYARLHEIGIQDELGVDPLAVMGSSMSFEQADLLAQIGKPVIVFFDGDKAGKLGMWGDTAKGTEGALHLLSRAVRTQYINYPKGIIDPDDLTTEQVIEMIDTAPIFGRKRVRVRP